MTKTCKHCRFWNHYPGWIEPGSGECARVTEINAANRNDGMLHLTDDLMVYHHSLIDGAEVDSTTEETPEWSMRLCIAPQLLTRADFGCTAFEAAKQIKDHYGSHD